MIENEGFAPDAFDYDRTDAAEDRVAELEAEGMTTSDAQSVAEAEQAELHYAQTGLTIDAERAVAARAAVGADVLIETTVNMTAYAELLDVMRAARALVSVSPSSPHVNELRKQLGIAVNVWNAREAGDSIPGSGSTEVVLAYRQIWTDQAAALPGVPECGTYDCDGKVGTLSDNLCDACQEKQWRRESEGERQAEQAVERYYESGSDDGEEDREREREAFYGDPLAEQLQQPGTHDFPDGGDSADPFRRDSTGQAIGFVEGDPMATEF